MLFATLLQALPFLLKGLGVTLYVSAAGTLVGCVIGFAICLMRSTGNAVLLRLTGVYVSFFRGVPLLVQLLLFYNFLPYAGLDLSPMAAAIDALGLVAGAYVAEILRGALAAIPKGHVEAALTLGFSQASIWRRVLLPQMFRLSTPAITNELILLIKASSLISVVGLTEVTRVSQTFASSTLQPMTFYLAAGALYLVVNLIVSGISLKIERRQARGYGR
jgi:polar amino acid transport system permease protein